MENKTSLVSNGSHLSINLEDGATLVYEVLGSQYLGKRTPLVLVGGMTSRRIDWERLALSLAEVRPVLIFDHRGMGDSRLSPSKSETITIELLARDLLALLEHLRWNVLSVCGFSMGGVVTQQLLFLPYHPSNPVHLPFRVTHVILAGTMCSALKDRRYGLPINKNGPLSLEQKRDIAQATLTATFDPDWIANPANSERWNWLLERMTSGGRPSSVILGQARALNKLDFSGYHDKLSKTIKFLVIHGELDRVVPPYCGQEILERIPWAKMVDKGPLSGQVPSFAFGHYWYEYFDIQVWHDVVENFLGDSYGADTMARL